LEHDWYPDQRIWIRYEPIFAEAFAGNRMEMLAFSKFVLGRVGDYFVFVDLHLVISTQ